MRSVKNYRINVSRREFIKKLSATAVASGPLTALASIADTTKNGEDTSEGISLADGPRPLVRYPGKRDMILVHARPPHLETPFSVFNEGVITPNDAFFVRYHLANLPTSIDPASYRLTVRGAVNTPLNLTLNDLKTLSEPVEVIAVNQCSGNSRGYSSPRVFGAQLGNGSMGNACWVGVPLKKVLEKAGIAANAKQVVFKGIDNPVLPATPEFKKALDIEHALSAEPLLAWEMNGKDLPFLNGYPLKLIVPGYFGTYWMKHVNEIDVLDHSFEGKDAFYMTTGYRVPDNDCLCVAPGTAADKTRPISTLPVRSFLTNLKADTVLAVKKSVELKGIAFDGGTGIKAVDVSIDGGQTWRTARLGENFGRYSFREWRLPVVFLSKGRAEIKVRATNNHGDVQPDTAIWNPGGYYRHVIESTSVTIA